MDFGVHLPLIDFGDGPLAPDELRDYTATAADLGYATLAANDHLVWQRPWLDGPTTLTSLHGDAGDMTLATSISLPTVRHPTVLAKWLTTLGRLTGNRIIAGLGPGSSSADYAAVGVPFEDRWARFDEALRAVKALTRGDPAPSGTFYDLDGVRLEPVPSTPPEVWFGSWGSDRRLRAMAQTADGWMASGYNTTPGPCVVTLISSRRSFRSVLPATASNCWTRTHAPMPVRSCCGRSASPSVNSTCSTISSGRTSGSRARPTDGVPRQPDRGDAIQPVGSSSSWTKREHTEGNPP